MPGKPHECWSLSLFSADAYCPTGLKLAALLEASVRAARPVPKDGQRQLLDSGTLNVTGTIARIALGGEPNPVGVEQHNNWAYVGGGGGAGAGDDQIISLIDLINRALSGTFTIPGKIGSLLFDQQGELLFVTLTNHDKLLKLDPNQASLISRVGVTKTLKDVAVRIHVFNLSAKSSIMFWTLGDAGLFDQRLRNPRLMRLSVRMI